jgi:transposase
VVPCGVTGRMCTVPKPFPKEFGDDVVRVARYRVPGRSLKRVAADVGISVSCLTDWLNQAAVENGVKPGVTADEAREDRELRERIRLLEQENEVLRRAAAYLSQASLPGNDLPARPGVGHGRRPRRGDVSGSQDRLPALLPVARSAGHGG